MNLIQAITSNAEIGGRSDAGQSLDGPDLGGLVLNENGTLSEPGPTISTHPQNVTTIVGQTAQFSVVATGTGTLHYQWKKGSTNVGTDSATLSLVTTIDDSGVQITCVVTDDNGSTTSNAATLTVTARVLTSIQISPANTKIAFNKSKQFAAHGLDQVGYLIEIADEIVWSTDSKHGEISEDGLFTAGAIAEECIITAAVGEIEGSANLKVVEKISTAKLTGGLRIGVSIRA